MKPALQPTFLAAFALLATCDNVQTKAASQLGINRNALHKKLKEYGLEGGEAETG